MASGSSTTGAPRPQAQPLQPGQASRLAAHSPAASLRSRVLHVAADHGDPQVGPGVQHLRLAPDRGGADDGAGRQAAKDRPDPARRSPAEDEHVPRILPRQRAGEHDSGRQLGFQVLQAMHGEVDAAVQQRLVDLLGE